MRREFYLVATNTEGEILKSRPVKVKESELRKTATQVRNDTFVDDFAGIVQLKYVAKKCHKGNRGAKRALADAIMAQDMSLINEEE